MRSMIGIHKMQGKRYIRRCMGNAAVRMSKGDSMECGYFFSLWGSEKI